MLKFLHSLFNVRRIKCKDGTERLVYRDIDSAFPLIVPGWEGNISSALKSKLAGDINISASYKSKIDGLLIALDEFNNNIIADFRAAYLVFHSNPCGNSDYLSRAIEKISDARVNTMRQKAKIAGLIEMVKAGGDIVIHGEFMKIYSDIVGRGTPQQSLPVTVEKIREAEDIAQDFIGRSE